LGILQEDLPSLAHHKEALPQCLHQHGKRLSSASYTGASQKVFQTLLQVHALAYQKIVEEADGESTATASLERIETLVDTCFVATTKSSKKKRKKLAGSGPTKKDLNRGMSVEIIYNMRGTKCQALQGLV
jgi:hypothetical protein